MTADEIDREYHRLGYSLGWTFMLCPEQRMRDAGVAIVGLNPGGKDDSGGQWDCPTGNVFYTQKWRNDETCFSPIQVEIQAWHDCLGLTPDQTFLAEFIPFRSGSEDELPHYAEAVQFGRKLWSWVLATTSARTFLAMGNRVTFELSQCLGAKKQATFPTGWGDRVIELWIAPDGRRVVGMPHPSRYTLFRRQDPNQAAVAAQSLRAAASI